MQAEDPLQAVPRLGCSLHALSESDDISFMAVPHGQFLLSFVDSTVPAGNTEQPQQQLPACKDLTSCTPELLLAFSSDNKASLCGYVSITGDFRNIQSELLTVCGTNSEVVQEPHTGHRAAERHCGVNAAVLTEIDTQWTVSFCWKASHDVASVLSDCICGQL